MNLPPPATTRKNVSHYALKFPGVWILRGMSSSKRIKTERSAKREPSEESNTVTDSDSEPADSPAQISANEEFQLRSQYRDLSGQLMLQRAAVARGGGVKLVRDSLEKVNNLFGVLRKSSGTSITATDSFALKEVGTQTLLATKSMRMGDSRERFDIGGFIRHFKRYCGEESEDEGLERDTDLEDSANANENFNATNWAKMGDLYYKSSHRPPTVEFLLGPLDIVRKPVNRRARRAVRNDAALVQPDRVNAKDLTTEDRDTAAAVEKCFHVLHSNGKRRKMNLFKFFIHPQSFAQSVENLFYTSFLISTGKVILGKGEDGVPYIQEGTKDTFSELPKWQAKDTSRMHLIFRFDYDTWLDSISAFDVESSFLQRDEA